MKSIIVPVKRVIDHAVRIRVKADGSGVDTAHVKMSMNPFDEIALEEALRIREKGHTATVVVASIGGSGTPDTLRQGLAMGADRAIHIVCEDSAMDTLDVAKILCAVVKKENPRLVLMGKQAIDDDCNQVGQFLAALLEWPQGTFASEVHIQEDTITVAREVDDGIESLSLQYPAVITVDLRLNQPRYASLPNIMKARQKPIETLMLSDIGYTLRHKQKIIKVWEPQARTPGCMVSSVNELAERLKKLEIWPQ